MKHHLAMGLLALACTVAAAGCSAEDNPLCCSPDEFGLGLTITASLTGDARAQVAVQAVADFAGIAKAAIDDLTLSCRNMATDLGATSEELAVAENTTDKKERMGVYCELAIDTLARVRGNARLEIAFAAPSCAVSVSAKASCEARCDVSGGCNLDAKLPTCEGGKLEVSCEGSCSGSVEAPKISCEGSCSAACEGSCTVNTGSVECAGRCEGTCSAGGSAGGNGIQADGSCKGLCQGTCDVVAPSATCSGSCHGSCTGTCSASGGIKVKCDGSCDGKIEPLRCEGGKLDFGCNVDAKCSANCDASIQARAECKPPSLEIRFSGGIDAQAEASLRATLDANFGIIASLSSRLKAMLDLGGTIIGKADAIASIKIGCIPPVLAAATTAVDDVGASVKVTGNLLGAAGHH